MRGDRTRRGAPDYGEAAVRGMRREEAGLARLQKIDSDPGYPGYPGYPNIRMQPHRFPTAGSTAATTG